jgi:hypothetical protein
MFKVLPSPIESAGKWISTHKIITAIVVGCLIIFFATTFKPRSRIADPQLILFLSLGGLSPLLGICRGFAYIFRKGFSLFTFKTKILILSLSAVLILIFSLGLVPFLIIAYEELYIQMTCSGGGCAQGGMGLLFFLPAPWLSYLVVRFANFCFHSIWPFVLKPDFSLYSSSSKDEIAIPKMEKS